MGVQLTELAVGEAHGQVALGNRVINFAYDPNAYTAEAEAEWNVIMSQGWAGEMVISFIQRMVISWDLLGDVEWDYEDPTEDELAEDPDVQPRKLANTARLVTSDEPFPLGDREKLRLIPMKIFGEITEEIQEGMSVGKAKKPRSGGGSGMGEVRRIR